MNKTKFLNRTGFTLMELLIVMAIIVALFALVLPALMSNQQKSRIRQAEIQVKQLESILEQYATENRGYPATEDGLFSLIYLPDRLINNPAGTGQPGMIQQPGMMTPGADPNAAFGGGAVAVGPEMLAGQPGMNPMGGAMPMAPNGMGANPMGGMPGMTDPMGGGMMGANPMDPMGGSGTMATAWNQPYHNPQLFTMLRKRSVPYLDSDKSLTDPWGNPYRYENTMQFNGLNRTGEAKPAVWSAGPDKLDNTEDDIRNWDPQDAQNKIAQRQQQMQMQGGMMGSNPMDPTGTGMADPMNPNMMGANPMDPMGGGGMPNQMMPPTGGGMPNQIMPPTGGGMPNQMIPPTGGGMPNQMMPPTGGGMPNQMPAMPNPMPPTTPM